MVRGLTYLKLALLAILLGGWTSQPARSAPTVESVTIAGNEAFDSDRIRGLMVMRPGGFLSSTEFQKPAFNDDLRNIQAFYRNHGYLDVQIVDTLVKVDTAQNQVAIALKISEGPLYRVESVSVLGNRYFTDSTLLDMIDLKQEDPYNPNAVNGGVDSILALYADSGYLEASVKPETNINHRLYRVSTDFMVTERYQSRISQIHINGLEKTHRNVVTRELLFHEGEIVRYARLLESQRRLYLTGLFESVFIKPVKAADADSTYRDIRIDLTEKKYGEFQAGIGYGTVEKIRGRVEVRTTNFKGTALKMGTRIEASFIEQGITASFTEPATFNTRWQTDVNGFYLFQQEPGYHLTKYGGLLTVGRAIRMAGHLTFTFRYENAGFSNVATDSLPDDIKSRVRSLGATLTHDTRDNFFDPRRGHYLEWHNELAGGFLRGNNSFVRSTAEGRQFWSLNRKTTIGLSMEVGWQHEFGAGGQISLNELFYTGGPNSVRGFPYRELGPKDGDAPVGGRLKLVWHVVELRRHIWKWIGVVGFVDAGNVWSYPSNFKLNDIRYAVGPGLRVSTPIGIVRLDWGINVDRRDNEKRSQLQLGIGQAF